MLAFHGCRAAATPTGVREVITPRFATAVRASPRQAARPSRCRACTA